MKFEALVHEALSNSWRSRVATLDCVEAEEGRHCYRVVSDRGLLSVKVQRLGTFFDDVVRGLRVQRHAAEHGIATNAPFPTVSGQLYEVREGYGIVVQPWIEGQPFRGHPAGVRALGELVGRLHALPVPAYLQTCWARLEPRRTLDAVRDGLQRLRSEVPARYRVDVDAFCEAAWQLDDFPSVPRAIIHTDLAWSNVLEASEGGIALLDFEGAGVGPPVIDLVEVTTYLTRGPSGSGPLLAEQARAFYEGCRSHRQLSTEELSSYPKAHFYHQLYHLTNALGRGDYGFIGRMKARLASWEGGVLNQITALARGES